MSNNYRFLKLINLVPAVETPAVSLQADIRSVHSREYELQVFQQKFHRFIIHDLIFELIHASTSKLDVEIQVNFDL